MPAMISTLKMEPKVTVGTNLAAASVIGISGLIGHTIDHNIDYLAFMIMGFAAVVGGYIGAKYTNRFSDTGLKTHNRSSYYDVFEVTMFSLHPIGPFFTLFIL